ncbi:MULTISPECIES: energy-coupling factor transporter transmembrane component T family protein [Fischerella]|uniref:Energy-coupling factor transporter transmembrane protein EcfT n=1 Tax=Fischerella muscicola CCMEE 5323 TaxID=2019572 RepID=A0A2N6K5S5_FISMU|nr:MULTISPECIES: energy-coupling factor transporter transmembrane component T [Fischerella]MBD2430225.1 energy-coupling factor transporter transmembrane protein EcfT [Fischerella sp. FACHB-380]PLZ91961.1 energy-coupling factor transporter transmembrane protein EcfT [Fischerella muscicola CCMEE 5323]
MQHTFLTQINPLLKIITSITILSIALILDNIWAITVLVLPLLLLVLISVRINLKILGYVSISLFLFMVVSTWLRDFDTSVFSTLRLVAIMLPTPLLASTTSPSDLIRALQATRLPSFLTLSLMLIWRFLPIIQQETQRILEANQLRGVDLKFQPQQWFSGLFIPLMFRIVAYADDVTVGLETRGYDPQAPRSNSKPLRWQLQDTIFTLSTTVMLAVVGYIELFV